VEHNTISQRPSMVGASMMFSSRFGEKQPAAKTHPRHGGGAMSICTTTRAQGRGRWPRRTLTHEQPWRSWTTNAGELQLGVTSFR